ncbi:MAG TPA: PH domain-containing protein [Acidimicrobiales bacterium]|nr:PH domain-containing protein [Acidimicrobiales bacterium]
MPFPERLLGEGEVVVAELHPHWVFLGWPLVAVVACAAANGGVVVSFPNAPVAVLYLMLALLAASLLWLAGRYLRRATTTVFVTSARLVRRSGVLSRRTLEIRLERINELSYHQTIGGRLLHEGQVLVEVGGETGVVVLDRIPHPEELQSVISEQVSAWHRSARQAPGPPRAPDTPPAGTRLGSGGSPAPSAAERLVQLDELRRRGIVSDAEYESKRAQLLGEL